MEEQKIKLTIGALLHDAEELVVRSESGSRTGSAIDSETLKSLFGLDDAGITEEILNHDEESMESGCMADNSDAYIVFQAERIASAADSKGENPKGSGENAMAPLQPVFDVLNGNDGNFRYEPRTIADNGKINFPTGGKQNFTPDQYRAIVNNLKGLLEKTEWTDEYVNALLENMETDLTYVPAFTAGHERMDISMFDHAKLTAALSCCLYDYLKERNVSDYRKVLYEDREGFAGEKAFLLFSLDVSGIQDFIYTIATKNALRTLRARSFYLEIMMQHLTDVLLERLELSRANLIYSGGGHCYMLLPNTEKAKDTLDTFISQVNEWYLEHFQTALYIAGGYAECSGRSLQNIPEGSYSDIFRTVSRRQSEKKNARYRAADILRLNNSRGDDYARECSVCKRTGHIIVEKDAGSGRETGRCPLCAAMEKLSRKILKAGKFLIVSGEKEDELPLPFGYSLVTEAGDTDQVARTYDINTMQRGKEAAAKIWVGNYSTGETFEEFAKESAGIDRIGILRADVDNLGHAFVSGFRNEENHDRYVTVSRTSVLSRQLSLFFKYYINDILRHPKYTLDGKPKEKRKAAIVYSGGDDLFIAGAWDDIIEFSVDLHRTFQKYTEGTLTISAGIGVYEDSYPISVIAEEVADMEDRSKALPEQVLGEKRLPAKNAVTLFEDGCEHDGISDGTYAWEELEDEVLGEKFKTIYEFFENYEDRGKAFLYHILELIRNKGDKINFARFVYLMSRLEPGPKAPAEKKAIYHDFSEKMCGWIRSDRDCRQLKTAINLYAYYKREDTDGSGNRTE